MSSSLFAKFTARRTTIVSVLTSIPAMIFINDSFFGIAYVSNRRELVLMDKFSMQQTVLTKSRWWLWSKLNKYDDNNLEPLRNKRAICFDPHDEKRNLELQVVKLPKEWTRVVEDGHEYHYIVPQGCCWIVDDVARGNNATAKATTTNSALEKVNGEKKEVPYDSNDFGPLPLGLLRGFKLYVLFKF